MTIIEAKLTTTMLNLLKKTVGERLICVLQTEKEGPSISYGMVGLCFGSRNIEIQNQEQPDNPDGPEGICALSVLDRKKAEIKSPFLKGRDAKGNPVDVSLVRRGIAQTVTQVEVITDHVFCRDASGKEKFQFFNDRTIIFHLNSGCLTIEKNAYWSEWLSVNYTPGNIPQLCEHPEDGWDEPPEGESVQYKVIREKRIL